MKTFYINGKTLTVGEDVFTGKDISCLGDEYIDYKIAVMQWCKDGGLIEKDKPWGLVTYPTFNWTEYAYRAVPKPKEPTAEEKLQKWIAETGAKIGDRAIDSDGEIGTIDEINNTTIWVNFPEYALLRAYKPDELELIKPEYRPYTFEEFCTMQMLGKAVKRKSDGAIGYISNYFIFTKCIKIVFKECYCDYTLEQFKDEFTWIDGEPCGVML